MLRALVFGLVLCGTSAGSALAQDIARELHDCFAQTPVRVIACATRIIGDGHLDEAHLAIVHNNRGNAHYKLRQLKLAIADYSAAIRLNPVYANPYNNRGIIHSMAKRYERAILDFDQAIARLPDYANAFNNRGYAHQKLNRLDRAEADYRKALEINPRHGNAKSNLKRVQSMRVPI